MVSIKEIEESFRKEEERQRELGNLCNKEEMSLKLRLDIGRGCLLRLESQFSSLPMGGPVDKKDPVADERYRLAQKGIRDSILGQSPNRSLKDNQDYMDGYHSAEAYDGADKQAAKEVLMGMLARVTPVYAPKSFLNAAEKVEEQRQS